MNRLYFDGDFEGFSSPDDEDNLPYPEALPRSDFLGSNFDAPAYLSTLSDRHQTLEDLRSDLRERSQALSKELLDLVNTNYEQFLSLGSDLHGGEEKVEDIRVGLLGFKRGVEDVKSKVCDRSSEVRKLLEEKAEFSQQIMIGRRLLELDARLEELEERLVVSSIGRNEGGMGEDTWSETDDEDLEDEMNIRERGTGTSAKKLQCLVQDYRHAEYMTISVGVRHPFIISQQSRVLRIRNTILLDLSTALKQAYLGHPSSSRLLQIMDIYRQMDEGAEAIKVLKSLKSK